MRLELPGSWGKINYNLRFAKNIERKMLSEAFQCLTTFGPINRYRYVGFGSHFFSDFKLFHRTLGITEMISIEDVEEQYKERFRFNRPYRCIKLKFGPSRYELPRLFWNRKTILWLDYDSALNLDVLADVEFFCANAVSGSVLVVTVDARGYDPEHPEEETTVHDNRLRWLQKCLPGKVPADIRNRDLLGWGTAKVCRDIIDNEVQKTLFARNRVDQQIRYVQLFNFEYQDSAKMLTTGGLLYDENDEGRVEESGIKSLPFIRTDKTPYPINPPNLTLTEIRHLDKKLPKNPTRQLRECPMPVDDLTRYANLHRYFPAFVEAEL